MRRLVFVTQQVDPAHPALAATLPKIRALAERVDEVAVLALGPLRAELPGNVRVRSFGAAAKPLRGVRYAAALAAELRSRPVAVVAHMCPIYAVLAAPLARPLRVPVVLWYTHWRASPTLRLAEGLSDRVTSVDRRSFPLPSAKVVPIGHGIDVGEFPCAERPPPEGSLRALALGRYSPAKGLPAVLEAVRIARSRGVDVRLRVHGPELSELERRHRRELEAQAGEGVELGGPLPRRELPGLYAGVDVLVNNMEAGAPDKVVYEAAASCLPVLASNPVFDDLLAAEHRFPRDDPAALAARLEAFAALGAEERTSLGRRLREQVLARHSVGSWADGLLAAAEGAS